MLSCIEQQIRNLDQKRTSKQGFFIASDLSTHAKRCHKRNVGCNDYRRVGKLLVSQDQTRKCHEKENMMITMRHDDRTKICGNDNLILAYGREIYEQKERGEQSANYVSSIMRLLARFVKEGRNVSEHSQLAEYIKPSMFEIVIQITKTFAGYTEDGKSVFVKPSLVKTIEEALIHG